MLRSCHIVMQKNQVFLHSEDASLWLHPIDGEGYQYTFHCSLFGCVEWIHSEQSSPNQEKTNKKCHHNFSYYSFTNKTSVFMEIIGDYFHSDDWNFVCWSYKKRHFLSYVVIQFRKFVSPLAIVMGLLPVSFMFLSDLHTGFFGTMCCKHFQITMENAVTTSPTDIPTSDAISWIYFLLSSQTTSWTCSMILSLVKVDRHLLWTSLPTLTSVSYTHLDVYKRQFQGLSCYVVSISS